TRKERGTPQILLYRKNIENPHADPVQAERVKEFFQSFRGADKAFDGLYKRYTELDEFEDMLFEHVERIISEHPPESAATVNAPSIKEERRRLDAAMPDRVSMNTPTEVRAMVVLPESEGLRALLPDTTATGEVITRGDVREGSLSVAYPVDPDTGQPTPIGVTVQLRAADFTIDEPEQRILLRAGQDSGQLTFTLTPTTARKNSIVHVVVRAQSPDGYEVTLGAAALRTSVQPVGVKLAAQVAWSVLSLPLTAFAGGALRPGTQTALPPSKAKEDDMIPFGDVAEESADEPIMFGDVDAPEPAPLPKKAKKTVDSDRRGEGAGPDDVDPMEWLESLANRQGAKDDDLITFGDVGEDPEPAPDTTQQAPAVGGLEVELSDREEKPPSTTGSTAPTSSPVAKPTAPPPPPPSQVPGSAGTSLEDIVNTALQLTGGERGYLALKNPDTGEMDIRAARGMTPDDRNTVTDSVNQRVADSAEPLLTDNASMDDRFESGVSVVQFGLRSIMAVPLLSGDEVIGVLYTDSRIRAGLFSETDIERLMSFASESVPAIENAQRSTSPAPAQPAAPSDDRRSGWTEFQQGEMPALVKQWKKRRTDELKAVKVSAEPDETPQPFPPVKPEQPTREPAAASSEPSAMSAPVTPEQKRNARLNAALGVVMTLLLVGTVVFVTTFMTARGMQLGVMLGTQPTATPTATATPPPPTQTAIALTQTAAAPPAPSDGG
ncbi:MAG: GAF domain-containing protein, partial [Chloroflexota bacterium]